MTAEAEKVLKETLGLPQRDRAVIAERLLASLDVTVDREVEEAWQEEVQRRLADVDSGRVECIPWEEVKARLEKA